MDHNFYKNYFEFEKYHWWFRVRRNIILSLLEKYRISKTSKIFDFGCGSGYTAGYLQGLGYNVAGADFSDEAIGQGRANGVRNLEVINNNDIKHPEGGFNLIMALDVVEHIKDDFEIIKAMERSIGSGGMLIMTVPAYMWLWGVQDDVAHHFRRYTMRSIMRLLDKFPDLTIVKKSYFNTLLFPAIVMVRFVSKWFGLRGRESDFEINNGLLNNIFFRIFNLESKLLKYINFPFGVSVLLVVKKK
ncbi:MAG: class I SAM-dependent methyltransferase [Candidatus Yanofskybacteria bacterium]|nr:class I SAM-dependent methyltransferase [Candidatus Yanofskybacteria bacterium]